MALSGIYSLRRRCQPGTLLTRVMISRQQVSSLLDTVDGAGEGATITSTLPARALEAVQRSSINVV
eukprot:349649-Chlamydomonas_euryale.AAC.7